MFYKADCGEIQGEEKSCWYYIIIDLKKAFTISEEVLELTFSY